MKEALTVSVRTAVVADLPAIFDCDPHAKPGESRRNLLGAAVAERRCLLAEAEFQVRGFVVLSNDFFEHSFVALIVVAEQFRRLGVGLQLLGAVASACRTPKLFTSTNASNTGAQAFFERAGFVRSGVVENLDENDRELIYYKWLRGQHVR